MRDGVSPIQRRPPRPAQGRDILGAMSRLAILAPHAAPAALGNAVTVARVARGLRERDQHLRVWDVSGAPERAVADEMQAYRPTLVHAFHAHRTGPLGLRLARRLGVPLVVTLTGTDANHDLDDPRRAPVVRRVLEGAAAITAFDASIVEHVVSVLPDTGARLVVIPQAVRFEDPAPFDLSARWVMPPDRVLFLLPAGIRPVKAPRTPLGPLDRLAASDARLRLAYAGPVLDADEDAALRRELVPRPWARHLGVVPHAQMASLISEADVVLNCSLSEGGMANAVLEALALGRAVLASNIAGNRALVEDDVTGLLFGSPHELSVKAERLARDARLRARLGHAGRALVEREFPPEREINGYRAVYRRLDPAARD
jgi:glycosyltransferase involved in cell wall biosynthesis